MLSLRDVRKRYGATVAVDGLSFEVQPGEIFGLLGPNGAGKTTTVHMAVGLLAPDAGTVSVCGRGAPSDPRVRAAIGVAPQALALYEALTAGENLEFLGRVYGLGGERLSERVAWALGFAGLTDRRHERVETFSGGMKRRLNLAAAVVHDPELILLDEPTAGVDPQSRNALFDSVLALRAAGRAIVYTTHYMEEAERLCDRVAIVDHGRLLALDTVAGLLAAHGAQPVLIVETAGGEQRREVTDPLGELNRMAAAGPVRSFRMEQPSLEQVFLKLTGRHLRD